MKFLCSEKISEHKFKTPEGYLVCVDSVLARTGKQTYKRSEIFGCDCKDAENEVDVDRPAEEVFSDKTLASFENKPLTIEHPDEDVNTSNHRDLAVGFARDIKRGKDNGQDVMLGTLVFTDEDAIEAIENGEMVELSCGYDADIVDEENPCQRNIRGNHIALCQRGRAGNARIVDSKVKDDNLQKGKTYVAKSGATLKVVDYECSFSDYNGEASVIITYDYVSASGKKSGRAKANAHDFWKMLTDKSLTGDSIKDDFRTEFETFLKSKVDFKGPKISTNYYIYTMKRPYYTTIGEIRTWLQNKNVNFKIDKFPDDVDILISKQNMQDSVKDNLELPEDEDSSFMYRDAYGKEIIVTNWDGKSTFLVEHDGTERQMTRKDVEYYLDRKGARFSRVLKDSIGDITASQIQSIDEIGADVLLHNHSEKTRAMKTELREIQSDLPTAKGATYNKLKRREAFLNEEIDHREEEYKSIKQLVSEYESLQNSKPSPSQYAALEKRGLKKEDISKLTNKEAHEKIKKYNSQGDSMKDGQLVEVPASTIAAFEGKVRGANINIDNKGRTWSGRLHYQLSYDASKADFGTFVKELERLEAWLESIDIPVTFSAGKSGNRYTAGFDIDKKWIRDRSTQDVDTYEEATRGLKKQTKEAMNNRRKDSKEDILQKIRTTQIREGDTFEMRDGQYLVQIQNIGMQELSTRSGPYKSNGKNESLRLSIKLSSQAWGRIWKNGTIVFNETDALNIVRDKMIQFLKTVRDSKRR